MLRINHRESHDVDIFLTDPQLLSLLDPQKRDFQFEIPPSDCQSDGARFLKLGFGPIGEIDFIVADTLTTAPAKHYIVEGEAVLLGAVPEIITKKMDSFGKRCDEVMQTVLRRNNSAGDVLEIGKKASRSSRDEF